jgi:hypothetical protein
MLLSKTVWELNIFSKECYSMKLDLLTNATAVDDAITFVYQSKEKLRKSTSKNVDHTRVRF